MRRAVLIIILLLAADFASSGNKDFSGPGEVDVALRQKIGINAPLTDGAWSGDIYILPYNFGSSYDIDDGNGNINIAPRQWVAQSFYQNNPDTYDFILVFTNFNFNTHEARAFYTSIKNDVNGIGQEIFDSSSFFGSSRLQGYVDAANLASYLRPDGTLDEESLSLILNHEIGHRWLAHIQYPDSSGNPAGMLLGRDGIHWSYLFDSNASYLYGSKWSQNADGTYTAVEVERRYSDLDLYLMGLAPPEQVAPMTLLLNPAISSEGLPVLGDTIQAQSSSIHIDGVVAANGARIPGYSTSPKDFRVAFVFLVDPATNPTPEQLALLDSIRAVWRHSFFQQTGGRAIVTPNRGVPEGGGQSSPNLNAGAEWLVGVQQQAGHWQDSADTSARETAEALEALEIFGSAYQSQINLGETALQGLAAGSTELIARQAEGLLSHQGNAVQLISELQSRGSGQAGWGAFPRYAGDPVTTARVIRALFLSGDSIASSAGWNWLLSVQNADGGWPWRPGGPSAVYPTLEVLSAAKLTRPGFWDLAIVHSAVNWLLSKQTGGGFGEPYPGIAETSMFLQMTDHTDINPQVTQMAANFVVSQQQTNGSWAGSVYETSLALRAVALAALPDPLVLSSEIYTDPESPYQDEQVTLHLAVVNDGANLDAGLPYVWQLIESQTGIVRQSFSGNLPAILNQHFASISDSRTISVPGGAYTLRFEIDPDGVGLDQDRTNNTVSIPFTVKSRAAGVDLVAGSFSSTPAQITSVPQQLIVEGTLANHGLTDAATVSVTVFDGPITNAIVLGSLTTSVPAGGSASVSIAITADQSRVYHLNILAMPMDPSEEEDPSDNATALIVPIVSGEDIAVEEFSASPISVPEGDAVTLSFTLRNQGTLPETGVQVGFSYFGGNPPLDHAIQLITVSDTIQPGSIYQTQIQWIPVLTGDSIPISVVADPQESLNDLNRNNNHASTAIQVQSNGLPNLSVSPASITITPSKPLQGQSTQIVGTVYNFGGSTDNSFLLELKLDDPEDGSLLASRTINSLGAGASESIDATWTVDQQQDRLVYVVVDRGDVVHEFNEADNQAFSIVDVQSLPDLVLTSGQIQWTPSFPPPNEPVHFLITLLNSGDQDAQNALLEILDTSGAVLASQTIASIPAKSSAFAEIEYTPASSGEFVFTTRINFAQTVPELSYTNNQASAVVPVQNGDLFVTEKFFSPNGDGVKDMTTIHFRNPVARLEIRNGSGDLVRTITDIAEGAAIWDGKSESGTIVPDGGYEIQAGNFSTWVIVDDNLTTISSNPHSKIIDGAMFVSGNMQRISVGPQEGEIFFVTQEDGAPAPKLYRHNGIDAQEIGDWPPDHDLIGCSADASLCLARTSSEFLLVRFPGQILTAIASPGDSPIPSLSPDGKWILWGISASEIIIQSTDDPGLTFDLNPCSTGDCSSFVFNPIIRWSDDSSVATLVSTPFGSCGQRPNDAPQKSDGFNPQASIYFEVIHTGLSPSAALHTVDDLPFTCIELFKTSTDFEKGEIYLLSNSHFRTYSALTGSLLWVKEDIPQPNSSFIWSLSTTGTVIKYTDFLYEIRTGASIQLDPALQNILSDQWTPKDKYLLGQISSENFVSSQTYLTIADNLILALRPRVLFGNAGIALNLLVADQNLDRFILEYADVTLPNQYLPIGVPSREPIYDDLWGTWIPPHKGRFILRLTAYDLAGNVHSVSKNVTWNGDNDIANLYSDMRYVSPASSPGVKDEYTFHYLVLRPANLAFHIRDENESVVRTIMVAVSEEDCNNNTEDFCRDEVTIWDGKDDAGNFVEEGKYWLEYLGARWPVTVDNTPPAITFEIPPNYVYGCVSKDIYLSSLVASVEDLNLDSWALSTRRLGTEDEWGAMETSHDSRQTQRAFGISFFEHKEFRLEAADLAGNTSFIERSHREEGIFFTDSEPACRSDEQNPCLYPNRPALSNLVDEGGLLNPQDEERNIVPLALHPSYNTLLIQKSVWGFLPASLRLEYRTHSPAGNWTQGTLNVAAAPIRRLSGPGDDVLLAYWDHPNLATRSYDVRLLATNEDGNEISSSERLFVAGGLLLEYIDTDLQGVRLRITNHTGKLLTSVSIVEVNNIEVGGSVGLIAPGDSKEWNSGCQLFQFWQNVNFVFQAIGHTVQGDEFSSQYVSYGVTSIVPNLQAEFDAATNCDNSPPPRGLLLQYPEPTSPPEPGGPSLYSPGSAAAMSLTMPPEPTGSTPDAVVITLNGQQVATAPYNANALLNFQIDPSDLPETPPNGPAYIFKVNYHFPQGSSGLLSACAPDLPFVIQRTPPAVTITAPEDGATVCTQDDNFRGCPNLGFVPVDQNGNFLMVDGFVQPCKFRFVPGFEGEHEVTGIRKEIGWWGCKTIHVNTLDRVSVEASPLLLSPVNTVGKPTHVSFSFAPSLVIPYSAEVKNSSDVLVRSISGTGPAFEWDGKNEAGEFVADGKYSVTVALSGNCPSVSTFTIKIDKTGPSLVITRPAPNEEIGTVLEARGIVIDAHFEHYDLQVRSTDACENCWQTVFSSDKQHPDPFDVLGVWNTDTYPVGDYEFRIKAIDFPGNISTMVIPIAIRERRLIRRFLANPDLVSPTNADGQLDQSEIRFALYQDADVTLEIRDDQGAVIKVLSVIGDCINEDCIYNWDGTDQLANPVQDGTYHGVLAAGKPDDPTVNETEQLSIIVDNSPPDSDVTNISEGTAYALPLSVRARVQDEHPGNYSIRLIHPNNSTEVLSEGSGLLNDEEIAQMTGLPDGDYKITIHSTDRGLNSTDIVRNFILDSTTPVAQILVPQPNAILNTQDSTVTLDGLVRAPHLDHYEWSYAPGDSPQDSDFIVIPSSIFVLADDHSTGNWAASSLVDGIYTLRLKTFDQLGRMQQDRIAIEVDNTPPQIAIQQPASDSTITEAVIVTGLVADAHLRSWRLDVIPDGEDQPLEPVVAQGSTPVNGQLGIWNLLPPEGTYNLRLTAEDHAQNTAEVSVLVHVEVVLPPAPLNLTAVVQNRNDVKLTWIAGGDGLQAGFNIYRNAIKINPALITDTQYLDLNLQTGTYGYTVRAVSAHGRESADSNMEIVTIDLAPPIALITYPAQDQLISGTIDIVGTAYSQLDFKEYRLSARLQPGDWMLIARHSAPVLGSTLATWETGFILDGAYELKLEAEDLDGNIATAIIPLTVDNTAPQTTPNLIQATSSAEDPDSVVNDVFVEWQYDQPPPDFAGYFLYRNGQLANADGPIIGTHMPYLLNDTTYHDRDLPDGTYIYAVTASDYAGNESASSNNSDPVVIDTHLPHAIIVQPDDGAHFTGSTDVLAESPDNDIVSLQFEYKLSASNWTSFGSTLSHPPFISTFVPPSYGEFQVQAVAADLNGEDPSPSPITLTHLPGVPKLSLQVDGADVTLSWTDVADPYGTLEGYNVYRDGSQINSATITDRTFTDPDSPTGIHDYTVTSMDQGLESDPSDPQQAIIYKPAFNYLYPLVDTPQATLTGWNIVRYPATVELQLKDVDGNFNPAATTSSTDSTFSFVQAPLNPGMNVFRAIDTDAAGNHSLPSDLFALVYRVPPDPVNDLDYTATAGTVNLTWNAVPDENLDGFRILRNGVPINETEFLFPYDPVHHTLDSSTSTDITAPLDGNPATGWTPAVYPAYWQWIWPEETELSEIGLTWLTQPNVPERFDLDVQAQGEWLWFASVYNGSPGVLTRTIPIGVKSTGVRIRTANPFDWHNATMTEVQLKYKDRTHDSFYSDTNLAPGAYEYSITELSRWGAVSEARNITAFVDVPSPTAPTLTVSPAGNCTGLSLSWSPPETFPGDLTGYNIYRSVAVDGVYSLIAAVGASPRAYNDAVQSAYFYKVSATGILDGVHIESPTSNVATAQPVCETPITPPVIKYPTTAGNPIALQSAMTDVSGQADERSLVRLFRNGVEIGEVSPTTGSEVLGLADFSGGTIHFSANGRYAVYVATATNGSRIAIRNMRTNQVTYLGPTTTSSTDPAISRDGQRIAYSSNKETQDGSLDLYVYNRIDGTEIRVPQPGNPHDMSFSPDGHLIAYTSYDSTPSSIIIYDVDADQTHVLYDQNDSAHPVFSPDGSKLLASTSAGLVLIDLQTQLVQIIPGDWSYWFAGSPFSPDGTSFLYTVSSPDALSATQWKYDLQTGLSSRIDSQEGEIEAVYRDNNTVDLVHVDSSSLWTVRERNLLSGDVEDLYSSVNPLFGLVRISGKLFVVNGEQVIRILGPGSTFFFPDVDLQVGTNTFVARQEVLGTTHDSLPIVVDRTPGALAPDATTTLAAFPPFPRTGDAVLISGQVENTGIVPLENCTVILQRAAPGEPPVTVLQTNVTLNPGSSTPIQYNWNTTGLTGDFNWVLTADPAHAIAEELESNNSSQILAPVRTSTVVEVDASTDHAFYFSGQTVGINVRVFANGLPSDYVVETIAEDLEGYSVESIDSRTLAHFGPGIAEYDLSWVIPDIYPGDYKIHLRVSQSGVDAASDDAPFTVLQPMYIAAHVNTSTTTYVAGDAVPILGRVTNSGDALVQNLTATFRVYSSSGFLVTEEIRPIETLPASTTVSLSWTWQSAGSDPGNYTIHLQVLNDSDVLVADADPAVITLTQPPVSLTGVVTLSQSQIEPGQLVNASASITNTGSQMLLHVQVDLTMLSADTLQPFGNFSSIVDLAAGESAHFEHTFDSTGMPLGKYLVLLYASGVAAQPFNLQVAQSSIILSDLTPPRILLISPTSGLVCDQAMLQAQVTDSLSGVLRVFYRLDGMSEDHPMPQTQISSMYGAIWNVQPDQDGAHQLAIFAQDLAGNISPSVTVNIDADSNPPVVATNAPSENSCVANPVAIDYSGTDTRLASLSTTLNGSPYSSGSTISQEGAYQLVITAYDKCDHATVVTRDFHLEWTPPSVEIVLPGAAECAPVGIVPVFLTSPADATLSILLNGQPYLAGTPINNEGDYQLVATIISACGNMSEPAVREFHIDATAPIIAINSPEEGACAAVGVVPDISGSDIHELNWNITLNGESYTRGTPIQSEGDYTLIVGASDDCGNLAVPITRTFSIDITPPVIAVTGVENGGSYTDPVTATWEITDSHLVSSSATLNGEPVQNGVTISDPGQYILIIQATDCASTTEITIQFELISSGVEHGPSLHTRYVLFFNNDGQNGSTIDSWLQQYNIPYRRVQTGCDFLAAMRSGLFDQVIINDPNSAHPIKLDECDDNEDCKDDYERPLPPSHGSSKICERAGLELSSLVYGRGGVMLVGDSQGEEDCILDNVAALGAERHSPYLNSTMVDSAGEFMVVAPGTILNNVRALTVHEGFPALLSSRFSSREMCSGVTAMSLRWEQLLSVSQLDIAASVFHPGVQLDSESGELGDGQVLDAQVPAWVNLRLTRNAGYLTLDISTTDSSTLPSWLRISVSGVSDQGNPVSEDVWLSPGCKLNSGELIDQLLVTSISKIQHQEKDYVVASGNRYGLGMGILEPWSISDNNSSEAWDLFAQGFSSLQPNQPRSIIPGTPLPVTITVRNPAIMQRTFRVQIDLPSSTLIEAWDNPVSTDPLIWEFEIPGSGSRTLTYWVLVPVDGSTLPIPATVSRLDGEDWDVVNQGTIELEPSVGDRVVELQAAISDLAAAVNDTTGNEQFDLRVALELLGTLTDSDSETRSDAACVLMRLSQAYELIARHQNPGEQAVLLRISRLIGAWERAWNDAPPDPDIRIKTAEAQQ